MSRNNNKNNNEVLIVEDDAILRELYDRLFQVHGYSPIIATNGKEALELFYEGRKFSTAVIDTQLGRGGFGPDLYDRIRGVGYTGLAFGMSSDPYAERAWKRKEGVTGFYDKAGMFNRSGNNLPKSIAEGLELLQQGVQYKNIRF